MKDIPMFTTDNGIASLTLKEIPQNGKAYVKIQSSLLPESFLQECIEFCIACGAESVFASGSQILERFPISASIIGMRACSLPQTDACLFPVTEETVSEWRKVYNERMEQVPNAAYLTKADENKLLLDRDCYFVHKDGVLLGIGKAHGDTIESLAAICSGAGRDVLLALSSLLVGDCVNLTVAEENTRAVALYRKLGFISVEQVSKWYKVF